jgi:hypothetical protein
MLYASNAKAVSNAWLMHPTPKMPAGNQQNLYCLELDIFIHPH